MPNKYTQIPPSDRFWPKVDKNGGLPEYAPHLGECWLWGAGTRRGYGRFYVRGRRSMMSAPKWAWEQEHGPVPPELELDHLCRVRACVRPSHLEAVTHQENFHRSPLATAALAAGIAAWQGKVQCPQGHPYNEANTQRYRGWRECRICKRTRERIRYWRARAIL